IVVEFWATWCPPCRSTLGWLEELRRRYGDNLAVLTLAVDSPDADVREIVAHHSQDLRWAIATSEATRAFGDVVSVPGPFVFDRKRQAVGVWYGAPPDLHEHVEKAIESILNRS